MMAGWLVTPWLVLVLVGLARGFQCPGRCICYPNFDVARTITVDCRGLDLFEIPFPIPPETSLLDVSNNLIEFVRTIDLPDRLDNLRFLQLQNNELIEIEPGALTNLPNLEVLRLTNNQVRSLRAGVFDGLSNLHTLEAYNLGLDSFEAGLFSPLTNLVTLDLSYNNLDTIPNGTFSGFQRLQRLLLSDNFLTTMERGAVSNLPSLNILNLANNQLRALDVDSISAVPRINSLVLRGNPFECGCDAEWLHAFLMDNNLNGPKCKQPETLRGSNLLELTSQEFCGLPTANITTPPVVIATGSTLQLQCVTTGFPPPTVTWSRNGMTFDPADSRIRMFEGNLTISTVTISDNGDYYCVATSSAGQVSASVPVGVVNLPINDTVTQAARGETVLLDCVMDMRLVEGSLTWSFNSTELQLSDKYAVLENGSLLIRNVDLVDMGEYVCTVGSLMLRQSLMVWAAPEFVVFPEGNCLTPQLLSVDSDGSVDLTCSVFGIPPPERVVWFYRGLEQTSSVPDPDMAGGVVTATINLFRPEPELSGNYTCVANSSLGTVQRTVTVNVRLVLSMGTNPTITVEHFVGETAVFECDLGDRIPDGSTVTWETRTGEDLPDKVIFADRNTTLILGNLSLPGDRAGYTCLVTFPNGTRRRLIYDLVLLEPPVIAKVCGIPIVTAIAGSNVSLECPTSAFPEATYMWTVNGSLLEDSAIVNRSAVMEIGEEINRNFGVRLIITNVREGDDGLYNCSAMNTITSDRSAEQMFQDSYTIDLQIQRLPYFTYQPEMSAVVAGDTATLLCGGRGAPTPTVTWFVKRNNETIVVNPDLRHIITSHALLILDTEPSDEGHYFCEISSVLMTRTSPMAHLRVYTPPQLGPLPLSLEAPVGTTNVTLDCFGSGDPTPVVDWLRGDQVLPISGQQVVLENGSLVLLELLATDAGVYTCRLANVARSIYHNTTVTVLTLPDTVVQPPMVTANVGCQVTFRCTDGINVVNDRSEVVWSHRGQQLEEGERVSVLDDGSLVLFNLDIEDSGNYTCTLWSELGFVQDTAFLLVEDPIFASGAPVSPPTITTSTPLFQTLPLLAIAQFVCFVEGFPVPEIEWLRNGVSQPNLRRVDIVNGGLTIRELRITDNATYTCQATNLLGSESIDFQLSISVRPSFDVRPMAQTVLLGGLLPLSCSASGHPSPDIIWLHNGSMVISEDNPPGRVFIDPQSNELSINRMTYSDAGLYTCIARSSAGLTETTVPVFVQDNITRPVIEVPPESVTVMAGLSVALDCVVSGVPLPTVSWLKDNQPIVPCTAELPMDQLCAMNKSIFIQVSREMDTGRYTCIAENIAGVTVSEAFVSILPQGTLPVFEVYPTPAWLMNGSSLRLDCQASGQPTPQITWLLDFALINLTTVNCSNGNLSSNISLCSNGSLLIPSVDFIDEGFYTCVAENAAGVNQVSVAVDVGIAVDTDIGARSRPVMTSTPTVSVALVPGNNVTLECTAAGNPPPIISWLRNRELLDLTLFDNLFQLANGSLLLTMANASDAGLYTCLAVNSEGSTEVTFQLEFDVLGRLATGNVVGTPVIAMKTKHVAVVEGSRVELPCTVKGLDLPNVLWEHNGHMVYTSARRQAVKNGSLVISYAKPQHSGIYSCMAVNKRHVSSEQVTVLVTPRPVPPSFEKRPTDTFVVSGGSFALDCTSDAPLSWYQDDTPIEGLPGHRTLCDGSTLLVTGIEYIGALLYRCSAYSKYGNSTSLATVTITSVPVHMHWYVELDSSLAMTCKDGAIWTRNGQQLTTSTTQFVNGQVFVLLSANLSDEGEYLCSSQLHYLHVTVPPEIVAGESLNIVHQGDTVQLHCTATGKPLPIVSWYSNGVQLTTNSNQHTVLSTGTLVLFNVTQNGQYDCLASSIAGEDKNTVYLHVL